MNTVVPITAARGASGTARRSAHKPKRPDPDWATLEILFRAGSTFRQLAAMPYAAGRSFQAIQKHAEKHEWVQDRAAEAQQDAARILAVLDAKRILGDTNPNDPVVKALEQAHGSAFDATGQPKASTDPVFHAVVASIVMIKNRQRSRIDKLSGQLDKLLEMLGKVLSTDPVVAAEGKAEMIRSGESFTQAYSRAVVAAMRLQEMEARAHNLEAHPDDVKAFVPKVDRRSTPGFAPTGPDTE
jgi:hypothetical protein